MLITLCLKSPKVGRISDILYTLRRFLFMESKRVILKHREEEETNRELKKILRKLKVNFNSLIKDILEFKYKDGVVCPHCGKNSYIVKYGKIKQNQRYKCKECGKTFSCLTFTPLSGSHYTNKWTDFVRCMVEGCSLRKASQILGISYVSLFYWRHKLLSALKEMKTKEFQGIVEMDDDYFPYSEKGKRHIIGRNPRRRGCKLKRISIAGEEKICILVALDRQNSVIARVGSIGKIHKRQIKFIVGKSISKNNALCTDSWREYKSYALENGIKHYIVKTNFIDKKYNIANVSAYIYKFKIWMERFKGVASKYLDNYIIWFKALISMKEKPILFQIKSLAIRGCTYSMKETCRSLREAEFIIS